MIFDWRTEIHRYYRYFVNIRGLTEKKSVRSFTNFTLTLLTISFFGLFAIRPTLIIIAGLKKEIETKQEINSKLQKKIASLVKAQEEFSLVEEKLSLLDQALPTSSEFPLFILAMEKEASVSGIELSSVSLGKIEFIKKEKKEKTPSFEFSLSATGDYENIKTFLARIENLRRSLGFKSASITNTKEKKEESSKIQLNVSGQANFYLKEKI